MLEQLNFAIFCKNKNLTPTLYFNDIIKDSKTVEKKYTHLMGAKYSPVIEKNIEMRLKSNSINLNYNSNKK